jgi:dolichyl-phosphate beta-glucosyltransferase
MSANAAAVAIQATAAPAYNRRVVPPVAPTLSVIIPCYNERTRLRRTIDDVTAWAARRGRAVDIVVVDDGSTDGTAELAASWAATVPALRVVALPRNRGKGAAVREGMLAARGERRAFVDADGAVPFEDIDLLERALDEGADVAVASRVVDTSKIEARAHRQFLGFFFRALVRALLVRTVDDTQCGFKLFRDGAATALFAEQLVPDFAFDVEVLARAERMGLHVAEIAVRWREQPGSKVRVLRDGLKMASDVLRLRLALGPAPARRLTARRPT